MCYFVHLTVILDEICLRENVPPFFELKVFKLLLHQDYINSSRIHKERSCVIIFVEFGMPQRIYGFFNVSIAASF